MYKQLFTSSAEHMNFPVRSVIQIAFYPEYFSSLEENMLCNVTLGRGNVFQRKSDLVI